MVQIPVSVWNGSNTCMCPKRIKYLHLAETDQIPASVRNGSNTCICQKRIKYLHLSETDQILASCTNMRSIFVRYTWTHGRMCLGLSHLCRQTLFWRRQKHSCIRAQSHTQDLSCRSVDQSPNAVALRACVAAAVHTPLSFWSSGASRFFSFLF